MVIVEALRSELFWLLPMIRVLVQACNIHLHYVARLDVVLTNFCISIEC